MNKKYISCLLSTPSTERTYLKHHLCPTSPASLPFDHIAGAHSSPLPPLRCTVHAIIFRREKAGSQHSLPWSSRVELGVYPRSPLSADNVSHNNKKCPSEEGGMGGGSNSRKSAFFARWLRDFLRKRFFGHQKFTLSFQLGLETSHTPSAPL